MSPLPGLGLHDTVAVADSTLTNEAAPSTHISNAVETPPIVSFDSVDKIQDGDTVKEESSMPIQSTAEPDMNIPDTTNIAFASDHNSPTPLQAGEIQASDTQSGHDGLPIPNASDTTTTVKEEGPSEMQAEWEEDSDPLEDSSSSSDSDSSDSDDTDDEEYEMMDPATAAKMLMAEEGGEDDDTPASKQPTKVQVRTNNEKPAEIMPRPNITITPETELVHVGVIQNIVDTFVLVAADTTGDYQVLEQGSILCLPDRSVLGAVAETLGRVQQPMYAVAFTSRDEIDQLGITKGAKVTYVVSHSTFVFTQALKAQKGTDASNLHDEEPDDHEIEFSDDEAEAAHKRARKEARKSGKSRAGPEHTSTVSAPPPSGPINYDDDEDASEGYNTLTRPTEMTPNLSQTSRGSDRSRGRGRGGRGSYGGDRYAHHNGSMQSFSDRQTSQSQPYQRPGHQTANPAVASSMPRQYTQHNPSQTHMQGYPQLPNNQSYSQQASSHQPAVPHMPPFTPQSHNMPPAGAYLNPNFVQMQATQQQPQPQQNQWTQHQQTPQMQQQQEYMARFIMMQQQQLQQQQGAQGTSQPSHVGAPNGQNAQGSLQAGQLMQQQLAMLRQHMGGQPYQPQ